MRAAKRITAVVLAAWMGVALACSDAAKPLGTGDKFINDTAGQDAYSPPPPVPTDSGSDTGYAPSTCASCSCDPSKNYCFSGGSRKTTESIPVHILAAGFGEDGGADADAAPPPPPCPVLAAGSTSDGCIPLPATCATMATCACLLAALQPSYACYLECSPSPGYLEVYCPNGTGDAAVYGAGDATGE
jgi:hypothetical protein